MSNNTYRTGTARYSEFGSNPDRWFVANEKNQAMVFNSRENRDAYLEELRSGRAWLMNARPLGRQGTIENVINPSHRMYRDIKFDEPEPVNDYEQKYEDLARALAAEAHKRKWCRDWENFADANDIPKELRTPPKVKLRVTLEVEVEDTENPVMLKSRVWDALTRTLGRAIHDGKVERL